MKKIPTAMSFAVGLHALAGTIQSKVQFKGAEAEQPTDTTTHALDEVSKTEDLITSTAATLFTNDNKFSYTLNYGEKEWRKKDERRYHQLVTIEALGTISSHEYEELERLQEIRQMNYNPPSGEEILQRHARAKLDEEMLNLLKKYVRFTPAAAYYSKAQSADVLCSS